MSGRARLARRALWTGLAGLAGAVVLALLGVGDFWFPYLFAALACLGLGLGGAALLMIHHLAGGRWGWCVRRPLEGMVATVPGLALALVPLAFGMDALYPWLGEEPQHEVVRAKAAWLNRPFFLARAGSYLVVWCVLALLLVRGGRRRGGGEGLDRRVGLAAVGMIVHVVTVGFAAVDWIASLEPRWYSSVIGFHVAAAQALGAMALVVAIACAAALALDARTAVVRDRLHDLGNLLLMLVVFDAYLAFSQYFIVWNGNLPEHVVWYVPRTRGAWGAAGIAMLVLQFALPLLALLFRAVKREPRRLLAVAVVVLVGRVIDSAWFVLPSAGDGAPLDLLVAGAAVLGLGGLWTALFLWQCDRRSEATG